MVLFFIDCGSPPKIRNGNYSVRSYRVPGDDRFLNGSSVRYFCNDGYMFNASDYQDLVCNISGLWSPAYPQDCYKGLLKYALL